MCACVCACVCDVSRWEKEMKGRYIWPTNLIWSRCSSKVVYRTPSQHTRTNTHTKRCKWTLIDWGALADGQRLSREEAMRGQQLFHFPDPLKCVNRHWTHTHTQTQTHKHTRCVWCRHVLQDSLMTWKERQTHTWISNAAVWAWLSSLKNTRALSASVLNRVARASGHS